MSGVHPKIKLINNNKPSVIKIRDTENLEVESGSDITQDASPMPRRPPPKKQHVTPDSSIPKNIPRQGGHRPNQGFDMLLNNSKQRPSEFQQSENSYDEDDEEVDGDYEEEEEEYGEEDYGYEQQQQYQQQQYGNSNGMNVEQMYERRENKKHRKQEMLAKLLALKQKGVELTREFDMNTPFGEIEFEYYTQRKALDTEAGVKFQRQALLAAVTGLEFLNKKFDPIGAKLNGWSESVMDSIEDYDEVFRKLYAKYSSRAELPPEIELLVLIVGGAFMFHMTNTFMQAAMGSNDGFFASAMKGFQQQQPQESSTSQNGPNTSVSNNIQSAMHKSQEAMTGPSINLSGMINSNKEMLPPPMVSRPTDKAIKEEDRFSMVSSETIKSASKGGRKGNKKITQIKTISI